tara:strand:+ start:15081 stop:15560 length:480 start_codon:yes stop_codon:yes gene_type:complete
MKVIKGDLLKLAQSETFDVIVHGCNCYHTMGAGIAWQIAKQFPEALEADLVTEYGNSEKLGAISCAEIETDKGYVFHIVNGYTQMGCGHGLYTNYTAIAMVMETVAEFWPEARIGYPKIGAGLGGGDWNVIHPIIDKALYGLDHMLVEYESYEFEANAS